jgi:hypothetical protein
LSETTALAELAISELGIPASRHLAGGGMVPRM